jgi:probable phosphoglycerate mutase
VTEPSPHASDRPSSYRQVRFERPPSATEIVLVRHGESADALANETFDLLDGRGDPELSPIGRRQAVAVCARLAALEIDAIYVTPLRRTAETAAPLAEATGVVPAVAPGLVEVHMGEWEGGLYRRHIAERDPLAVEVFEKQRWDVVPGAESNESLVLRTSAAINEIAATHSGGRVVVVSHAVAISTVLATAAQSRPFAFVALDNAAISVIVVDGERWTLRRFNDTAHLESDGLAPL